MLITPKDDDEIRKKGFDLFSGKDTVRRITVNITAVKGELEGYHMVEFSEGKRKCDCFRFAQNGEFCEHIHAALLGRSAERHVETERDSPDEASLRCRYCGSPDISRCGFRYNARGISRRYYCNECERKFSAPYVESQTVPGTPSGTLWLLSQVAMLTSKLNDLLRDLDQRVTSERDSRSIRSNRTEGANTSSI